MTCRRCSECKGMTHHWIADLMPDDADEYVPGDFACKHCDQRGDGCDLCAGDGRIFDAELGEDGSPICPNCNGEGVLPVSGDPGEIDDEPTLHLGDC